jgi:hypothetical protein
MSKSAAKITSTHNIFDLIDRIADAINTILDEKQKERYLAGILMLYSFIEKLLLLLVYVKIVWNKSSRLLSSDELRHLKDFCNRQEFYPLLRLALAVDLVDYKLFARLESVRTERNSIVHQFWLYNHRENRRILRKKLEKLARVANDLVGVFNKLVVETGADRSYSFFTIQQKKEILI